MNLLGIPAPVINCEATNLPEAWKKFHQWNAKGPLKSKSEEKKVSYLLLWVGEKGRDVYNTWAPFEGEEAKKLQTHYDN